MTSPERISCIVAVLVVGAVRADKLPEAAEAPWPPLRTHCRELLAGLAAHNSPLPPKTSAALHDLLERTPADADAAVRTLQQLLDPFCLAGVSINPESRVKVARGPADAHLQLDKPTLLLVKVQNDAGVTAPLGVSGPQLLGADARGDEEHWLHVAVLGPPSFPAKLLGQKLQYVVLRLVPRAAGKREATLRFDVGQGSQDLGFRAEAPVLFQVRPR